jgi:oligoribonuclease (3'-5' exoribonuclease)
MIRGRFIILHKNFLIENLPESVLVEYQKQGFQINTKQLSNSNMECFDKCVVEKASCAGSKVLVEDSVFLVNKTQSIRKDIELLTMQDYSSIDWIVNIGIMEQGIVYIYRGITAIDLCRNNASYFLHNIKPTGEEFSFFELKIQDLYEIATIITDGHFNIIDDKGYQAVVLTEQRELDKMNPNLLSYI